MTTTRWSGLGFGDESDFLRATIKLERKFKFLEFAIKLSFMEVEQNVLTTLPVEMIEDCMGKFHCRRQRHAYLKEYNGYG